MTTPLLLRLRPWLLASEERLGSWLGYTVRTPPGLTRVSFSGTRGAPTEEQRLCLRLLLPELHRRGMTELHHGDCVGGDALAAGLAPEDVAVHSHPPENPALRAYARADVLHPPAPYRARNRNLLDSSGLLLAMPRGEAEEFRGSGTWMTVRMARGARLPVVLLTPSAVLMEFPAA